LLEREQDLAILEQTLAGPDRSRSAVVVIEGPAGIGKTRLLAEGRALAHEAGARTLAARASELEGELAFGVVHQLFEGLDGADEPLGGAAAATSRDVSFATLHALYGLTTRLAAQAPLVIAVDDLHWCDEPSLRFLNYLIRRLDGLAVTVLCTVRPRERRARSALVGEIAGDPLTLALRPSPLSDQATARLVSEGLGETADAAFATACHTATGGNPLLLKELIRTLHSEGVAPGSADVAAVSDLGPRAVSRAVLVRLGRLDEDALKLARAASILRSGADLALLAALAGLDVDAAASAAGALVAAEILSHDEDAVFVHPLVGAAVYDDVPAHERSLAHGRAAQLLHEAGSSDGAVAAHLALAPARGQTWVCDVLESAARASLRAGAPVGAVHYLTRALSEPPAPERRPQLLLDLGSAEAMLSTPSAIERLTAAFERSTDPAVRTTAAVTLARTLLFSGRGGECVALVRRVSADLEPGDDARLALEALELMAATYGLGRPLSPERLARRLAPDAGAGAKSLAAVVSRQWAYAGGHAGECAQLALDALADGDLMAVDIVFLSVTAILTLVRADRPEADEQWENLQEESRVRGSLAAKAGSDLWRGYAALRRGALDDAEAFLDLALDEFRLLGSSGIPDVHHAAFLSAVLRERDDLVGARRVLEAVDVPRDASDAARYWLDSLAELLLAERRWDEALVVAQDMERRFAFIANPLDTPARSHRAVALYHVGHHAEGLALAAEALEQARRWGAPGTVARALRILGTLRREEGLADLREAVATTAGSVAQLEHAKALVALGATLRRARKPSHAREPLRQGLELADALGARRLVAHARHELRAAGVRTRTSALTGPDALTPAERRVAQRAAAGETNRVIAEALFVTDKTVELHLRNAYRKLGVRSRRELPTTLEAT
jgi:ATP/maltotriose-dependent transcriptional regulator MalT